MSSGLPTKHRCSHPNSCYCGVTLMRSLHSATSGDRKHSKHYEWCCGVLLVLMGTAVLRVLMYFLWVL